MPSVLPPVSPLLAGARAIVLAIGLAGPLLAGSAAGAMERVEVQLDLAKVVHVPADTKTMVLGNPAIADVTLLKRGGIMVITGKSYGETNLLALNSDGVVMFEASIRVSAAGGKLTVQRGMDRQSYICNPICQPTISLGDEPKFLTDNAGQSSARIGLSQPQSK